MFNERETSIIYTRLLVQINGVESIRAARVLHASGMRLNYVAE